VGGGSADAVVAMTATTAPAPEQRERILDAALHLMADSGVHAMTMRSLATACGLNVATLYHYFPSKQALLSQVIAAQRYEELLAELPPVDPARPAHERLAATLEWIWASMGEHDDMWKLLLGESLRGDEHAMTSAAELSATFEHALEDWCVRLFDDVPGDPRLNARVLRGLIYGFFIELMALPARDRRDLLANRADEIATVFTRS
jgi:AcrR family transcriptional regulator